MNVFMTFYILPENRYNKHIPHENGWKKKVSV